MTDDRGNNTPGGTRVGTSRSLPTEGTTLVSNYKSIIFLLLMRHKLINQCHESFGNVF